MESLENKTVEQLEQMYDDAMLFAGEILSKISEIEYAARLEQAKLRYENRYFKFSSGYTRMFIYQIEDPTCFRCQKVYVAMNQPSPIHDSIKFELYDADDLIEITKEEYDAKIEEAILLQTKLNELLCQIN